MKADLYWHALCGACARVCVAETREQAVHAIGVHIDLSHPERVVEYRLGEDRVYLKARGQGQHRAKDLHEEPV